MWCNLSYESILSVQTYVASHFVYLLLVFCGFFSCSKFFDRNLLEEQKHVFGRIQTFQQLFNWHSTNNTPFLYLIATRKGKNEYTTRRVKWALFGKVHGYNKLRRQSLNLSLIMKSEEKTSEKDSLCVSLCFGYVSFYLVQFISLPLPPVQAISSTSLDREQGQPPSQINLYLFKNGFIDF